MSNDVKGFVVVLKKSIKKETAEAMMKALYFMEGVIKVVPQEETINDQFILRQQIGYEIKKKIFEVLKEY